MHLHECTNNVTYDEYFLANLILVKILNFMIYILIKSPKKPNPN